MGILNPPEVNKRAVRDMGLAAWFGGSLMGATATNAAGEAIDDRKERIEVVDKAWKRALPLYGAGIASYFIGSQLAREDTDGRLLDDGLPVLFRRGPENVARAALAGVATAAGVAQPIIRAKIASEEKKAAQRNESGEAANSLKKALKALQWVVPTATAWMLFLTTKEDVHRHHLSGKARLRRAA